jgi:L-lactate permease
MAGRQLPFMTVIVLFWLMAIMDGWRGVKETWPAVLVAAALRRDAVSHRQLHRPELPDITSAIVSLVALTSSSRSGSPSASSASRPSQPGTSRRQAPDSHHR